MKPEARHELEILTTITDEPPLTQRALAERLGIALGLSNLYLKRLVRKGYIKASTIPPHRLKYLVTPRGLAHKTRLTYEYLRYSLQLYGRARRTLRGALGPLAQDGVKRVALCGTGEAAELAYLTLRELGLEPARIFDDHPPASFLGVAVRPLRDLAVERFDRVVVASFDDPSRTLALLDHLGVPRACVITLRKSTGRRSERGPDRHPTGVEREKGGPGDRGSRDTLGTGLDLPRSAS